MKKIFFILFTFFTGNCQAQILLPYHDSTNHLSYKIPVSWDSCRQLIGISTLSARTSFDPYAAPKRRHGKHKENDIVKTECIAAFTNPLSKPEYMFAFKPEVQIWKIKNKIDLNYLVEDSNYLRKLTFNDLNYNYVIYEKSIPEMCVGDVWYNNLNFFFFNRECYYVLTCICYKKYYDENKVLFMKIAESIKFDD